MADELKQLEMPPAIWPSASDDTIVAGGVASPKLPTMDLLSIALHNHAAIDVIERLAALREKEMARSAEIELVEALQRAQSEIKRIAPDLENQSTHSKYASYAAIDRVIRPIYAKHGICLSFSHGDSPKPEHVRVLCYVSLGAHTRTYQIDMPADGKGAKGGDVMTKTHATAAADSYAKRYLIKDIFNIAIGEDDDDGNLSNGWLQEQVDELERCETLKGLEEAFKAAASTALDNKSMNAYTALKAAKDKRKAQLK